MAVIVKASNYNFLQKVGVPEASIAELKVAGIKVSLGYKDFALVSAHNVKLSQGALPLSSNEIMKGLGTAQQHAETLVAVEKAVNAALAKNPSESDLAPMSLDLGSPVFAKSKPAPSAMPKAVKVDPATVLEAMATDAKAEESVSALKEAAVISLRDATKMYQRVNGSSGGSVYVAVALNKQIKVAARIHGAVLDVRVEGSISPQIKNKLAAQGLSAKGDEGEIKYMSAHFNCGKVLPERVMGALLVGIGIQFETPLPDMTMVKKLGVS